MDFYAALGPSTEIIIGAETVAKKKTENILYKCTVQSFVKVLLRSLVIPSIIA
jgi:hypothetical protein